MLIASLLFRFVVSQSWESKPNLMNFKKRKFVFVRKRFVNSLCIGTFKSDFPVNQFH